MKSVKLELKYCERCGTLKLRPVSTTTHYCLPCERMLARYRFPRRTEVADGASLASTAKLSLPAGMPVAMSGVAATGRAQ